MAIAFAPGPFEMRLPLGGKVDALADRLMTPPGMAVDFSMPAATFGFLNAYSRFASPLSRREMDQGIAEALLSGELYGADRLPTSVQTLESLFAGMDGSLVASSVIGEFLDIMSRVKAMPAPLQPLQRLLLKAAVSLLPDHLQERLGLEDWRLRRWEERLVRAAAGVSDRIVLTQAPPAQACRRLGLPSEWLYRRQP